MAELHFQRFGTGSQGQQLVTKTDAKSRNATLEEFANGGNRVITRLRIAGTVGQEDAVRIQRQHIGSRRLGRHHSQPATTLGQHAQDVALDAKIVSNDMETWLGSLLVTIQRPLGLGPRIVGLGRNDLGQVHASQAREGLGQGQRLRLIDFAGQNAPGLSALFPQDAGQLARIDASNGNDTVLLQVGRQVLLATPARGNQRQVTNDQASGEIGIGFKIFRIATGVADMRVGQRDDLTAIGGIGKDFLVAGHSGVEHHLATGNAISADGLALENRSVGEGENGRYK